MKINVCKRESRYEIKVIFSASQFHCYQSVKIFRRLMFGKPYYPTVKLHSNELAHLVKSNPNRNSDVHRIPLANKPLLSPKVWLTTTADVEIFVHVVTTIVCRPSLLSFSHVILLVFGLMT